RAIVGDAVADLVDVADTRGGPADVGALDVDRAVDACAVAVFLEVADAGREAARGAGSGDVIGGATVGDTVADVVEVTDAGRGTAGGAPAGYVVSGAAVADAVAALRHVADAGGGAAHRRALDVVRARDARAGARLREVAGAGGRTTRGAAGNEAVGGTAVADPVAALGDVADAGRRPADGRALGIVRARGA